MVINLLRICAFAVIYCCPIRNYVMIFKHLAADFRSLEMKRFSMKEDENRIDTQLYKLCFCLIE